MFPMWKLLNKGFPQHKRQMCNILALEFGESRRRWRPHAGLILG